ncbi:hypothetical protein LTR08_004218 [Meristemomyces frigidus]|nr:hypothetical protein LTR08_004218 [Meristemomyces frigidus]
MPGRAGEPHWLSDYASKSFEWQNTRSHDQTTYYRRLGLVEACFDADGRHYEGRADLNALLELEVKSPLTRDELHRRILLAWTCLRSRHLLLQSRAVATRDVSSEASGAADATCFAVDLDDTPDAAVRAANQHIVFLDAHFDAVDPLLFWTHAQNATRVVDPATALAKLFVLPLQQSTRNGRHNLRFLFVGSHQIWCGLTVYVWMRSFVHYLNCADVELHSRLRALLDPTTVGDRFPLPQEALYPALTGSVARQRWYWLTTRLLRHVRRPLQAGFSNPLRRAAPLTSVPFSPTYASVLDYSTTPPLNSMPCFVGVSMRNTQRLHRLCREAKVSIGAGCFALAALVMMDMYETLEPDVPLAERKPFISGFPLNPRAFFNHHSEPDSLMLAFSDGIALPFLSASLSLDGRIKLLARQAHRQLSSYQKRPKLNGDEASLHHMSSRGAGRLLAMQYVSSVERSDAMLPAELRKNVNPQGAYPLRPNATTQTCGVSSVGRRDAVIQQGMYDLDKPNAYFVADYRGVHAGVRPREGEFLVGIGGADDGLWASVSIDASAMDPALVLQWRDKLEHILDEDGNEERARL